MPKRKFYEKKHSSRKARAAHIQKIIDRGGAYQVKGQVLRYSFPKPLKDNSIKARTMPGIIKESAKKHYRKVKVVFKPAYHPSMENLCLSPQVVKSLKKSKVSIFHIPKDLSDIVHVLKKKDFLSIEYT